MSNRVKNEVIVPASEKSTVEWRRQFYLGHEGFARREIRAFESQSDTYDYTEYRDSQDNGKTWGQWVRPKPIFKEKVGEDEISEVPYPMDENVWNPVHKHYLTLLNQAIHVGGYEKADKEYWEGKMGPVYHTYLEFKGENGKIKRQFITYEKGDEFDKEDYQKTNYLSTNIGLGTGICVLRNGDFVFGLYAPTDVCCKFAGLDIDEICPSVPSQLGSLLVCRGNWNSEKKQYDFTFSKPIILDDRQSSRGIAEPIFAELESGRILTVLRMSNDKFEEWGSRISPYAPSYKLFSVSEDGGKTFSAPMPWHYNTREVIYSSATYSLFLRSITNGKLYWFGNITNPTETVGNHPRYPLYAVEVDDTWGHAKKETLTVIDTRRDDETEVVQLSNFSILQDRETGAFEIYLAKIGQFVKEEPFKCETWKYTVNLE